MSFSMVLSKIYFITEVFVQHLWICIYHISTFIHTVTSKKRKTRFLKFTLKFFVVDTSEQRCQPLSHWIFYSFLRLPATPLFSSPLFLFFSVLLFLFTFLYCFSFLPFVVCRLFMFFFFFQTLKSPQILHYYKPTN